MANRDRKGGFASTVRSQWNDDSFSDDHDSWESLVDYLTQRRAELGLQEDSRAVVVAALAEFGDGDETDAEVELDPLWVWVRRSVQRWL